MILFVGLGAAALAFGVRAVAKGAEAERIRIENEIKRELREQNVISKIIEKSSASSLSRGINEIIRFYNENGFYLAEKREYSKRDTWYASLTFKKKK